MTISVVVVTWNGLHLLQPCVGALAGQTLPHELVIVDNGSHDGTAEWVRQSLPTAQLIALSTNRGFAGGNNVGMCAAHGDLIVLLNNDTIAAPDVLAQLVAPFATKPRLGATAGVLTFAHRPELIASAGVTVGRDGVHRDAYALQPVRDLPAQPLPIFGASGGAVCYRRAALDDVGFFAEHFFAYLEDADLAWRLRLRGWDTLLVGRALVQHVYSATSGQDSPFKQRLLARNRWGVIMRCWPARLLLRALPAIVWYDLLALVWAAIRRQPAIAAGRLEAWKDWRRLRAERQTIQERRTVPVAELERWLTPPAGIRGTIRGARALTAVLRERSP